MDVIGIDLGGTTIHAGIVNGEGILKDKVCIPTPTQEGREGIEAALVSIIEAFKRRSDEIGAVGIGSAGRIDSYTGRVLFATDHLPGWTGTNVKAMLENMSGLPAFVENDVNAAALGEGWQGAARDLTHYVMFTIGTGVGGALVHDGKLINGPTGSGGEFGHIVLYPDGERCNCGQRGCVEQYVSGSALTRRAQRIDPEWDSYRLIEQAAAGHTEAIQHITLFVRRLAMGLVTVYNVYDPEGIILGGGVSTSYPIWKQRLATEIRRFTPHHIHIVPGELGDDAGIIGAAYLALKHTRH